MTDRNEYRPGYKKTKVGWIPEDWEVMTLNQANIKVIDGDRGKEYPKTSDYLKFGYCIFLSAKNITENGFNIDNLMFISKEKDTALRKGKLQRGDIVITTRGTVGNIGLYDETISYNHVRINSGMAILRNANKKIITAFLKTFLTSEHINKQIYRLAFGSAQPQLTLGLIKSFKLIIPTQKEQKHIVRILKTWDRAIKQTRALIDAKRQLKRGLMQQLLTGRLRFPGFGSPVKKKGELPEGWERNKLGNFFLERKENDPKLPLLSITNDEGVIPHDQMGRKDTSSDNKSNYKVIKPGDIGYNTMRMWQGRSAYSNLLGIVSPAYTICKPKKNVDSKFASYLFQLPKIINLFYRYSQGLVSDTWNLKFYNFAKIRIAFPPLSEQRKISELLSKLDSEIEKFQNKIEILEKQKKGLMQILLSGTIRVNELKE